MGDAITRLVVAGLIDEWEPVDVDDRTVFEVETDDWQAVRGVVSETGWRIHGTSSPNARRIYDPSQGGRTGRSS